MKKLIFLFLTLVCASSFATNRIFLTTSARVGAGVVTGGGGPTQIATDNFDAYGNGTSLGSQTNWTTVVGSFLADTGREQPSTGGGSYNCIRYSGGTFNANQYSTCTVIGTGTNGLVGVSVRCQSGTVDYYSLIWNAFSGKLQIITLNAGTPTLVVEVVKSYATGTKLWLEVTGTGAASRLTAKEDTGSGWVNVWTSQDPGGTYINGGVPGVAGVEALTDWFIDNWSAGNT